MTRADGTVHIVDDDLGVRRSLDRLLGAAGFKVVTYGSGLSFLEAAPALTSGCVLLDVRMPGIGGLELLARLKQAGFRLPVIIMTGHGDIPTAVRAIRAGAVDFLEKPFDDEQLITATKSALLQAGSPRLPGESAVAAVRIAALSRRERQVLEGLMAGHQNKVIAYELGISVRTVEVHRSRMLEHLGTRSLADAIRLAVMANLTSTAEVAQSK